MIRVNMNSILENARDKYTLVMMSSRTARSLIAEENEKKEKGQFKAKDAYSIKDSSKYLSESVKAIENGEVLLK